MERRWIGIGFIIVLLLLAAHPAGAQSDFPQKPIEIVVPHPAGSPGDLGSRLVGEKWSEFLGQPVIVVNKVGAMGAIGARSVARAKPDGYTLLNTGDSQLLTARLLQKDAGYNLDSFRILFNFSKLALFVTVKSDAKWKTLPELFADARSNPGKLQYAQLLNASQDLAANMLFKAAGVKISGVPYKSSPECLTALAGGNVDLTLTFGLGGLGKSGMIRALATSDDAKLPNYPNLPTLKELGYAIPYTSSELGFAVPAATPEPIVSQLISSFQKARAKYEAEIGEKLIKMEQYPTNTDGQRAMQKHRVNENSFKEYFKQAGIQAK